MFKNPFAAQKTLIFWTPHHATEVIPSFYLPLVQKLGTVIIVKKMTASKVTVQT